MWDNKLLPLNGLQDTGIFIKGRLMAPIKMMTPLEKDFPGNRDQESKHWVWGGEGKVSLSIMR